MLVAHYPHTVDIEAQSAAFETEVRPSAIPLFIILFPEITETVVHFILIFCLSIIIWCFRLGGWYLRRLIG